MTDGPLPFTKILGPGLPDPPVLMPMVKSPNVAMEHRHVRQDSRFSATIHCLRLVKDSLSVTDSGSHAGSSFEAPLVDFCVTKFRQNFLRRHLKENDMLKNLASCHSGAPLQPGGLRTCVPCLMVTTALLPPPQEPLPALGPSGLGRRPFGPFTQPTPLVEI